jgi:hypothetical protein
VAEQPAVLAAVFLDSDTLELSAEKEAGQELSSDRSYLIEKGASRWRGQLGRGPTWGYSFFQQEEEVGDPLKPSAFPLYLFWAQEEDLLAKPPASLCFQAPKSRCRVSLEENIEGDLCFTINCSPLCPIEPENSLFALYVSQCRSYFWSSGGQKTSTFALGERLVFSSAQTQKVLLEVEVQALDAKGKMLGHIAPGVRARAASQSGEIAIPVDWRLFMRPLADVSFTSLQVRLLFKKTF